MKDNNNGMTDRKASILKFMVSQINSSEESKTKSHLLGSEEVCARKMMLQMDLELEWSDIYEDFSCCLYMSNYNYKLNRFKSIQRTIGSLATIDFMCLYNDKYYAHDFGEVISLIRAAYKNGLSSMRFKQKEIEVSVPDYLDFKVDGE